MGVEFSFLDLLAYGVGIGCIYLVDSSRSVLPRAAAYASALARHRRQKTGPKKFASSEESVGRGYGRMVPGRPAHLLGEPLRDAPVSYNILRFVFRGPPVGFDLAASRKLANRCSPRAST